MTYTYLAFDIVIAALLLLALWRGYRRAPFPM